MLNYEVDRGLLKDYVPAGTVLDSFEGRTFVSLVACQFRRTKLFGLFAIPFHAEFDEVNLRFYVRPSGANGDRRGVVFVAEIVPKWAVAKIARLAYGENYVCLPMKHRVDTHRATKTAEYGWKLNGAWCRLNAHSSAVPAQAEEGSLEQFITEHYWGYSARRGGESLEYHVSHDPWNVWKSTDAGFDGDPSALYGAELGRILERRPDSAFIADGSAVKVSREENPIKIACALGITMEQRPPGCKRRLGSMWHPRNEIREARTFDLPKLSIVMRLRVCGPSWQSRRRASCVRRANRTPIAGSTKAPQSLQSRHPAEVRYPR